MTDTMAEGLVRLGPDLQVQVKTRPGRTRTETEPATHSVRVALACDGAGHELAELAVWRVLPLAASNVEAVYVAAAIEAALRLHLNR